MLYTVEVPLSGDVGKVMSNMRTWLGQQRFEPDSFRQIENDGAQPRFRLEFKIDREAAAFAAAFGGRVLATRNSQGNEHSTAA